MGIPQGVRRLVVLGALVTLCLLSLSVAAGPAGSSAESPPITAARSPVTAPPPATFERTAASAATVTTTPERRRTRSGRTKQGALAVILSTLGLLALVIGTIVVVGRSRRPVDGLPRGIFGPRRESGPGQHGGGWP